MSKKKQSLDVKIKRLPKTIAGFYKKDENGKTNKVGGICFGFACALPFVVIEGVKLGLYGKYSLEKPIMVILNGLTMPFFKVLKMKDEAATLGFGTYNGSFNWVYLQMFVLAYGVVFASLFINADRNKDKDNKKDGDMKFGNIDEFNEDMAVCNELGEPINPPENDYNPGNMILSNRVRYALEPVNTNTYSCALVVGPTGCGKTFTYVKPNILQMNSSYIITDPKGELTSDLGSALMKNGYNIKIFNINEPEFSCKYNPFHYIRSEEDVISAVNVFLDNTKETSDGGGDPFFPLAEKNFYLALFFYIYTVYKDQPEKQTFKTIYEIYQGADEPEVQVKKGEPIPDSPFDKIFKKLAKEDPSNPSLQYYSTFKKGSNKTKQSILISVGVKLWFMSVPSIANLMSGDTLEIDKIGDRKTALFIIIPSEKKTFRFLSAMLFTQIFETLYYVGNTLNEKSFLLQEGNCIALRSEPFIAGTESERKAKEKLISLQCKYKAATIEDDNELIKTDPEIAKKFDTVDEYGIKPFPMVRLIYTDKDGKTEILEEFQSRKACETVLHAAIHGTIKPGIKELANHTRFMLDEFYNIGVIPDFDMKIATFRSLRISSDIIIQSIAQLRELYDDREAKITNNCSIQILLGASGPDDCQYFSDLIGQTTVKSESASINHKGIIPGVDGTNLSDNAKMLLRPEQIRTMHKDKCLIVVTTKMPLMDNKFVSTKHERWGETFSSKDLNNTIQNRVDFRRIFRIKQEDKNKIITILPKENVITDNREKKNVIKGKDVNALPDKEANNDNLLDNPEADKIKKESFTKVGIDRNETIKDINKNYEQQVKNAKSASIGMSYVETSNTNVGIFAFMNPTSITPKKEVKTVPRNISDKYKIKEEQLITAPANEGDIYDIF